MNSSRHSKIIATALEDAKRKMQLLKQAGFDTDKVKCVTVDHGTSYKLVIKHSDDYEASLMSLFLTCHGIANKKEKLNLTLLADGATKLGVFVTKNVDSYHKFFAYFSRLSSTLKVSGYFCQEAVQSERAIAYFTEDQHCIDILTSLAPARAITHYHNPYRMEINPLFIDELSAAEYKELNIKLREIAERLYQRREYITKLVEILQPKHQDKTLAMKFIQGKLHISADTEVLFAIAPLLSKLDYNNNTIELSQFDHADCLKRLANTIALCQIRLNLLKHIHDRLTGMCRGQFEFGAENAEFRAENAIAATLFENALNSLNFPYTFTNNVFEFTYADLFKYVPETFPDIDGEMLHASYSHVEEACRLNQQNADVLQSFEFVLSSLVINNQTDKFIAFHDKYPRDINATLTFEPMQDTTLLEVAINMNADGILKFLIAKGADIKSVFSSVQGSGRTPLHAAAMLSTPQVVRTLIENGANVNEAMPVSHLNKKTGKRNKNSIAHHTPIYVAVIMNRVDVLHELLRHGAKLHPVNQQTLLDAAIMAMANNVVDELIELNISDTALENLVACKKLAAEFGVRRGNIEQSTAIITSFELLTSRMHATLQFFRTQSSTACLSDCQWSTVANCIYLRMTVHDDFMPCLELYLKNMAFPIIKFDQKHLYIPRNYAFRLHEVMQSDLSWKFFTRMIEQIMKYFRLRPDLGFAVTHDERLDLIFKQAKIPTELQSLINLADEIVNDSIYYISLNKFFKLSPKEIGTIIKSLEASRQQIEGQIQKLHAFIDKLSTACAEKIAFKLTGTEVTLELSARQTASLQTYLNQSMLQLETIPDSNDETFALGLAMIKRNRLLLDKFVSTTALFGKRSITYRANALQIGFLHPDHANRFRETCPIFSTDMQCSYTDIFALTEDQLALLNQSPNSDAIFTAQQQKQAAFIEAFKPCLSAWKSIDGVLSAEISDSQLPALKRIKCPGLTLVTQPKAVASIKLVDVHAMDDESLTLLANDVGLQASKLKTTIDILCKLRETGQIIYLEDGIELIFKNEECRQHFNACCTLLTNDESCQQMKLVVPYTCFFNLPLDAIIDAKHSLAERLASHKKIAEEPRVKVASVKRGKADTGGDKVKLVTRTHKKTNHPKPPKAEKPKPKSNIPPQREIDLSVLKTPSLTASSCLFSMTGKPDVFDQVVIPRVLAAVPREPVEVTLGDIESPHDYVIQYELTFLRSLHEWFAALDRHSEQYIVCQEILRAGTQLSLIRLMNAIDLRLKADRHVVHISNAEDFKAAELRATLIHDRLSPDDIEKLYQELLKDEIHTVFNDALNGKSSRHRPSFSKYLTLFNVNHIAVNYNEVAAMLLQRLQTIKSFMQSAECGELVEAYARRALQSCIIQLGELFRHRAHIMCVPHQLLKECKELRNTGSHNNTADDDFNCDPLEPTVVLNMVDQLLTPTSPRAGC